MDIVKMVWETFVVLQLMSGGFSEQKAVGTPLWLTDFMVIHLQNFSHSLNKRIFIVVL